MAPDGPSPRRRWSFWPMPPAARPGTMPTFDNSPGTAMVPSRLLRPVPLLLLALGAVLLVATDPSAAAETARRLTDRPRGPA